MKLWEIEEGKEFRAVDHPLYDENCIFKIINKEIYIKTYDDRPCFEQYHMSYNSAVTIDFEYLPEKKYYLMMKPEMMYEDGHEYLNYDISEADFGFSTYYETGAMKTIFTVAEIDKLIPPLYLKICDKVEVDDD